MQTGSVNWRELKILLRHSESFSAAYINAASAFRRMVTSGAACTRLLSDAQRHVGNGTFEIRLSGRGLHAAAEVDINRLGNATPGMPAPGTRPANINLDFVARPDQLPSLESEVRRLIAVLVPAPEPSPKTSAEAVQRDLPEETPDI
jgi:hypothetical protein